MVFSGSPAGGGADQGTEQQGDEAAALFGLAGSEGQGHDVGGRAEGRGQSASEGAFRDGDLVGGDGEAALGDVEDALGGAAVAGRVVQDALGDAVGVHVGRDEGIGIGGEGHDAGHAFAIEIERVGGQAGGARGAISAT